MVFGVGKVDFGGLDGEVVCFVYSTILYFRIKGVWELDVRIYYIWGYFIFNF